MASFHGDVVQPFPVRRPGADEDERAVGLAPDGSPDPNAALSRFRAFIRSYTNSAGEYIYRAQLAANYEQGTYLLRVELEHLRNADSALYNVLMVQPVNYLPLFEQAARQVIASAPATRRDIATVQPIQVVLSGLAAETLIRDLAASQVSRVVALRGIVIGAARPRIKATRVVLRCRGCHTVRFMEGPVGFGTIQRPKRCDQGQEAGAGGQAQRCPVDPFEELTDLCEFVDTQSLRLQEAPEVVPTSEMPRHIQLLAERYLVDAVKPGSRVTVIGIHSTFTSRASSHGQGTNDAGVRVPFLRVLGITQDSEASDVLLGKVTPEDEDELRQIAEQPDVYEQIVASIAPDIKTHDDIKKAIACSLFGGSRKVLPDGMRLRGDINILLLGDPGVAKSQFLRFAHEAAPISVYTSGKGSSAAGLTASVVRDPATGDFQLEGGAMVLADGGIVCIDEFDKMREQDRVAIHEAMEQQTISVAKAGITTILNSRTSVIAAANPQFGRYDDFKSAAENIHFQASILSRFDLIFIIRDIQDSALDAALADHIVRVHKRQAKTAPEERDGLIPVNKIKKLIAFARRKSPRLSDSAADLLADKYVEFRQTVNQQRASQDGAGAADVIPVTVRQLEALARISESLARMELSDVATEDHVREALRLFKVATMQATSSPNGTAVPGTAGFGEQMKRCEEVFSALVPIGQVQNTRDVVRALISQHGFDERVVTMCLDTLVQRGEFHYQNRKRQIQHTQRT